MCHVDEIQSIKLALTDPIFIFLRVFPGLNISYLLKSISFVP